MKYRALISLEPTVEKKYMGQLGLGHNNKVNVPQGLLLSYNRPTKINLKNILSFSCGFYHTIVNVKDKNTEKEGL